MDTGNLFRAFDLSAAGLAAQRARLNAISANIANAQTTRTPEGGPYRRRVVRVASPGAGGEAPLFEKLLHARRALTVALAKTQPRHLQDVPGLQLGPGGEGLEFSVEVDTRTPTRLEYEPGHPDANEEGFVEYPNVEIIREMVDLMAAARAYEANVTVLNSTKSMLRKALEI